MVPIPNSSVSFGNAKEMSRNDIARLNTLYKCCKCPHEHIRTNCTYTHLHTQAYTHCQHSFITLIVSFFIIHLCLLHHYRGGLFRCADRQVNRRIVWVVLNEQQKL